MKNCTGLTPALVEIYDLECREISDLDLAVVTLYHPNHAISIATLRALAKALQEADAPSIRLIVLHSDAVSRQDMRRIFGDWFGSGMTYWIRNGKIVTRGKGYSTGERLLLATRTKLLLKEH